MEGPVPLWVGRAWGDPMKQWYLEQESHLGTVQVGLFLLT